jgi:hypothetical protein
MTEITHNRRLVAHKRESSSMAVIDSVLVILGRSLVPCAPESGPLLTHNWFYLRISYSSVSIDSNSVAKFVT